jgi:tripeptidyl-peptidase I
LLERCYIHFCVPNPRQTEPERAMLLRHLLASLSLSLAVAAVAIHDDGKPPLPGKKRAVLATHAVHEHHPPQTGREWTKREKLPADVALSMRVGLRQSNLDAGHDKLIGMYVLPPFPPADPSYRIDRRPINLITRISSDPASPNYGKHMTEEDIIDFFAPHESSVNSVTDWLVRSGIARGRMSQSYNKQVCGFRSPSVSDFDRRFSHAQVGSYSGSSLTPPFPKLNSFS